ncbi:hypothetical protein QL285_065278 [Trifolium repens]|nr:hypothetical protein QL285_065278 [Trifolium repens]
MASRQNPSRAARNTGSSSSRPPQQPSQQPRKRRLLLPRSPSPPSSPPPQRQPRGTIPQENVPFQRFRTEKEADRYRVIATNKFVQERKFENNFEDFPEVNSQLVNRGWTTFNDLIGHGNDTLIREFFAHAHRAKETEPYHFVCVVRGVNVDYSARALNRFLGLPHVETCVVRLRRESWGASEANKIEEMKDRRCMLGTTWLSGQTMTQRVRLRRLNPEARVWAEFISSNLEPSGNNSEVTVRQMILIDAICAGKEVDVGLILRDSIQKIADKSAPRATLGHCSFLTRYLRSKGVPETPEDRVVRPKGPVTLKWLEKTIKTENPLGGQGDMDDLEAEIDGFDAVDLDLDPPNMGQPDMGVFQGPNLTPEVAPNQHSVNEMAALLTQMDISNALRLPHNFYDQTSSLYRESMTYREQFYTQPYYPLYPTMAAMQDRWNMQDTELRVAQMRERDAWLLQQANWQVQNAAVERHLFGDTPRHDGSSHAGPSMPHPNDPGDGQQ